MIDKKERNKIIELIKQGLNDYRIGKKLNHSPNTIKPIRDEYFKTKENQLQVEEVEFSIIDETRKYTDHLGDLIKNGQLKAKKRKETEKSYNNLRELIRTEVDERISAEKAEVIKQRDLEWNKCIEQYYVRKEIATDLSTNIIGKVNNIENLNEIIKEREKTIDYQQDQISSLKKYIEHIEEEDKDLVGTLNDKITNLYKANFELKNYIKNHLTNHIQIFNFKKEVLERDLKDQKEDLDKKIVDADTKLIYVKNEMEKLDKKEEDLEQREDDLNKTTKEIYDAIEIATNKLTKRAENVANSEEMNKNKTDELKSWNQRLETYQTLMDKNIGLNMFVLPCSACKKSLFLDFTNPETNQIIRKAFENYMHPECIEKENKKSTLLTHAISGLEPPILLSGNSPIIQSGKAAIVVKFNSEPNTQSGFSPNSTSTPNTKIVYCSGEPTYQSSYSSSN